VKGRCSCFMRSAFEMSFSVGLSGDCNDREV
jgi:hypothetical protein